ncbi:MAG: ThiF family adenylyltransferase [Candidatus Hatepunaea meridiana]|nr:ThiF family adenylyltransferase [Candidatus Hatepunaea meridiana]
MMGQIDTYALGDKIDACDLKQVRSIALLRASESLFFVSFCELRGMTTDDGSQVETIIFEVEPEVPQKPVNDIRNRELVAIVVRDEFDIPEVLALREDFPLVPHTNLRPFTTPKSLCLYEDIEEARLKFAPGDFLENIRDWFSKTALGKLHQDHQQLEPFVMTNAPRLILPVEFKDCDDDIIVSNVYLGHSGTSLQNGILYCVPKTDNPKGNTSKLFRIISVRTQARKHGIINRLPLHFGDLRDIIIPLGVDLLSIVRSTLKDVVDLPKEERPAFLILALRLPRKRITEGSIENEELISVIFEANFTQLVCEFGLCQIINGELARLVPIDENRDGSVLKISILNTCTAFDSKIARSTSGTINIPDYKITLIGCGAIGSQLQANMARMGIGTWTFIDDDLILPHNFARHLAMPGCEGFTKAELMGEFTANLLGKEKVKVIQGRLQNISSNTEIFETLKSADVIVDATTSIAASRELALASEIRGRRISLFLNPSGTDAVLLYEDEDRTTTLDSLEMQYYRFLMNEPQFENHLEKPESKIRYSNSCRDFSFVMPQSRVGMFAGILSGALIDVMNGGAGGVKLWRLDEEDWSVKAFSNVANKSIVIGLGEWSVIIDEGFLHKVRSYRVDHLPDETGGVLLGCYDVIQKKIYLVDVTSSPEDSIERVSSYVRGTRGLRQEIEQAILTTSGQVDYMGEWHSHPVGASANPSSYDLGLLGWIGMIMDARGLPGVEMIIADNDEFCLLLVGAEENSESLKASVTRREPTNLWFSAGRTKGDK